MTVLSRALQIRRALSSLGRMRDITTAVTRFGFGELLARMGFRAHSNNTESGLHTRSAPERLRLLLESLGPTFIKIGQLVGGRPDLIPLEYLIELEKLQDRVESVPYPIIKNVIEVALGKKIEDLFSSFDPIPVATASIAQVHAARTIVGDDVVVKVQKPEVERLIHKDFEILEMLAELVDYTIPETRPFKPIQIIREFKRLLLQELDFTREGQTIQRYQDNFKNSDFLVIPKVFEAYSTSKVITLQRIQGFRITDLESYAKYNIDPKVVLQKGLDCHMESLLVHGLFHADPHAGNMFVQTDGRLALLDFGSVGWLSPRSRDSLVNLFLALVSEDYEGLIDEYIELSPRDGLNHSSTTRDELAREVSLIMAPYYGMRLKDIPAAKLMLEASHVAFRYHVRLPQDLIAVFKSNMILEGIGRTLDPDFDMLATAMRFSRRVLRERARPTHIVRSLLRSSRDVQRFVRKGPRLALEVLRQVESGQLEVKLKSNEWEKLVTLENSRGRRHNVAALFLGSVILLGLLLNSTAAHDQWLIWTTEGLAGVSALLLLFGLVK